MRHPDELRTEEILKREHQRLSELKDRYRQEVLDHLQEVRSQSRQRMKYIKDLNLSNLKQRHPPL